MLLVRNEVSKIWTVFLIFQSQVICILGDCGPPPVIEHTVPVEQTSGAVGATIVYKCDRKTGYYESPGKSNTITCQDDETWSTLPEFCARGCGAPDPLHYGMLKSGDLEKDIFLPGTSVSYECREGYSRVPSSNSSIICLDHYVWSTPSEFCKLKSCGNPGEPLNGEMEAPDGFLFGSRVTYKCNEGHRMESKKPYRDCQANGKWSNDIPHCEVVICLKPMKPENGSYESEKDEYNYLDAVTFTCINPLHLIGASSASCTSDGTWSTSTPNCTGVNCVDPGSVQNAIKTSGFSGSYTLNSAVRFECEKDFVMRGSSSITCNVNSQWEPKIPECLSVCGTPPSYPFAELEESFANLIYFDKTTVLYKCKSQYTRDPNKRNQITCSGRSWSVLEEFCSQPQKGLGPGAIAGIVLASILIPLIIGCCIWWKSKKKSGEYLCENKNDKFNETVEQELTQSKNIKRKPKSEVVNVEYTACNDA